MTIVEFNSMTGARSELAEAGIAKKVGHPRMTGLDLLRVGSVSALIWFHISAPGSDVAYAGLIAVLAISMALTVIQGGNRSLPEEARRRAGRLLVPWLFWSACYGSLMIARSVYRGQPVDGPRSWWWLLIGPSLHLWYLPFAMLATMLALALRKALAPVKVRIVCAAGVILGVLALIGSAFLYRSVILTPPFGLWNFGFASIPFGMAIGSACQARPSRVRPLLLGISASCIGASLLLDRMGDRSTALAYGVGIPLVCLAICWQAQPGRFGQLVIPLSMGIYVLHPFVFEQLYRFGLPLRSTWSAIVVTLVSALMTLALRETPIRRFL